MASLGTGQELWLPAELEGEEEEEEDVESQRDAWLQHAEPGAASEAAPAAVVVAGGRADTVFTNAKAGMHGVDSDLVRRVVYEASKDSDFFKEAQRRDAEAALKAAALKARHAALPQQELAVAARQLSARVAKLEAGRNLSRSWLCVDMDAFFASVEERDAPHLRTLPMAVGGVGMIATSNYVARTFGVRSAMPGFIGLKLCPQLIFVAPNFDKYTAAAAQTREVFARYDPLFMAGSLDEAFLDVTEFCARQRVLPQQAAAALRAEVLSQTGLTCSAGIGANRMLAKIASDMRKPDGQHCVDPTREDILTFMASLAVRKVPGVGRVTEKLLAAAGVVTCGDALRLAAPLSLLLSARAFEHILCASLGLGETARPPPLAPGEVGRRGMGVERTFADCCSPAELEAWLTSIAGTLAEHMASEGLRARVVTLKIKTATFELRTRQAALPGYVCSADELLAPALRLLRAEMPLCARLLGLRASSFYELEPGQRTLGFAPDATAESDATTLLSHLCGLRLGADAAAEHADWHVARELHHRLLEEDHAAARKSDAQTRNKGKRPAGIAALFQRRAKQPKE